MTIATNEWHPKMSNSLLEKTCLKEAFAQNYLTLKQGKQVGKGKEILKMINLRLAGEDASVAAYFVTLPQAVRFRGITKAEY